MSRRAYGRSGIDRGTRGSRAGWVPESGRTDLGIPEETGVFVRKVLPARKKFPARKRFPVHKRLPELRWGLAFRRLLLLLTVLRESYV